MLTGQIDTKLRFHREIALYESHLMTLLTWFNPFRFCISHRDSGQKCNKNVFSNDGELQIDSFWPFMSKIAEYYCSKSLPLTGNVSFINNAGSSIPPEGSKISSSCDAMEF